MLRQIQTSHAPWKPRGSLKPHCPPVCSLQYIYKWLWPLYFLTTILLPNKEIIFNITDKSKSLDRPKYIHSWSTRCLINNYEISSQQNTTWILKEVPDSLFVLVSQHSLFSTQCQESIPAHSPAASVWTPPASPRPASTQCQDSPSPACSAWSPPASLEPGPRDDRQLEKYEQFNFLKYEILRGLYLKGCCIYKIGNAPLILK